MSANKKVQLVIHGGCGAMLTLKAVGAERAGEAENGLRQSLLAGHTILLDGGSAVDAVMESVKAMEDNPIFNAGKGSVFTTGETNECDAGIMDGASGLAGGVSTLTRVKNPIVLAAEVMRKTPHALLCGSGAETFAADSCPNVTLVDPTYFFTEARLTALRGKLKNEAPKLDFDDKMSQGTVGAVALDKNGLLAAGSSTGGMTGKLPGRVSDSSVVGAGFFADSRVGISATGNGDFFLRHSSCRRIADLVELKGMSLRDACDEAIRKELKDCSAGVIGVDSGGNVVMPFNTPGMFRGMIDGDGRPWVATFL